jgi:hypothetical protein
MDLNALFSSPEGMGLLMTALMGGAKTMQGNQAAMATQDPSTLAIAGQQGGPGYLSDPRHAYGASKAMTAHGQSGMGASIIGNSMVDAGATLTSKQARAGGPQMMQSWQQQGAVAPGLMQNIVGSLGGGMAMGNMASKMFRG